MSAKQTNEKQNTCCEPQCCSCCDSSSIAKFLRHVAEFFEKQK